MTLLLATAQPVRVARGRGAFPSFLQTTLVTPCHPCGKYQRNKCQYFATRVLNLLSKRRERPPGGETEAEIRTKLHRRKHELGLALLPVTGVRLLGFHSWLCHTVLVRPALTTARTAENEKQSVPIT